MKTKLYIVRHGKTMFNTIGRAQGWSDSPLTKDGEVGIHELGRGLYEQKLNFKAAFSSDSGRTMLTMNILMEELKFPPIVYLKDKRLREWCFGSLDGGYDEEIWEGVLPRTQACAGKLRENWCLEDIANGIYEADTARWAQTWTEIKERIWSGFEDIAYKLEQEGGGNALIVSHGMTISTLCALIQPDVMRPRGLDNGSVTIISYEKGKFNVEVVGDMSYRIEGKKCLEPVCDLAFENILN